MYAYLCVRSMHTETVFSVPLNETNVDDSSSIPSGKLTQLWKKHYLFLGKSILNGAFAQTVRHYQRVVHQCSPSISDYSPIKTSL